MSFLLKQIAGGQLGTSATADPLYTAVINGKAQLVKSLRFTNTSTTAAVTLNVWLYAQGAYRQISPMNLALAPGAIYIESDPITLEAGNKFKVTTGATGGPVDWVVSGMERDQ